MSRQLWGGRPGRRGVDVRFRPRVEELEGRTLPDAGLASNLAVYDPGQVLVQFDGTVNPLALLPAGARLGEALPLVSNLYTVELPAGWSVPQLLAAVQNSPHVLLAQPDYQVSIDQVPNDASFGVQWGLNNTGQSGGKVDADIDGPEAWDKSKGSGTVIVAVIDTGIDYNHPDLAVNIWTNSKEVPGNGVDDDGNGFVDDVHGYDFANSDADPWDDNSHGTHVAGIIGAASNNGSGVAGVAWNVQLMAVKFLNASGSGSTSNAIKGLNYAVGNGAVVSNNSWGGGGFSQALSDAIKSAGTKGHIFVAAAGNNGTNNDSTAFYPANYNLDNVVSVAASDRYDNLASFSNYGASTVDLAAPGVSIYSTLPNNSYGYKSGTSMATPFVTGALAMVRDQHAGWSNKQVIDQVLNTVDPLSSLTGKVATGGRLNLSAALSVADPALSINDVSVVEGDSGTVEAVFTVTMSAASTKTVTVDYATADGTASAGVDYQSASGSLSFAAGETSKTITVAVYGDTLIESNEAFYVNLSSPANASISRGQGTGTIIDDDTPPAISIDNVKVLEGDTGTTDAVFTVSLSAAGKNTVTVDYATADGTATAGSDYLSASGTLSFATGETSKTISITVYGDTLIESDETFYVNLSGAKNATISTSQGTGTILDDDNPVSVSIGNATVIEGNSGTVNAVFTVTLSAASGKTVTVDYATANGAAIASADFIAASASLSFAPGETSKTISVAVLGDTEIEPDEAFYVNLANPSNATITASQGVGTIRNDDASIAIGDVTQPLARNGTTFVFTVTLAQASALTVTVKYATADGTLKSPNGYNAVSGTLTFAPGVTSQTISVKVKKAKVGDYLYVNLSSPSNAALADSQGLGTISSASAGVSAALSEPWLGNLLDDDTWDLALALARARVLDASTR